MQIRNELTAVEWDATLQQLPNASRDVYFFPEYHTLHVANGDGKAYCAAITEDENLLLISGLRSAIPSAGSEANSIVYYDIQTCNGYGGPLATPGASRDFLERAWAEWRRTSAEEGIVAAFFRLHPMINNEMWLPNDARVIPDRETVFVELGQGLDAAWRSVGSSHRNMVSKGRRDSVQVVWNDPRGWQDFESLYADAMGRLQASSSLLFSRNYFAALRSLPGVELATVRDGSELAAGAVFLVGPCWGHYHLSARRPDSANYLTNCILQAAIERAAQSGLKGVHLGGGRTRSPDDGLFKFKRGIGTVALDFKVALVVSDNASYAKLCRDRSNSLGRTPTWLLGYRESA